MCVSGMIYRSLITLSRDIICFFYKCLFFYKIYLKRKVLNFNLLNILNVKTKKCILID